MFDRKQCTYHSTGLDRQLPRSIETFVLNVLLATLPWQSTKVWKKNIHVSATSILFAPRMRVTFGKKKLFFLWFFITSLKL